MGATEWIFDPVPPSGAIVLGIPVAYVFTPELSTFVREVLQNAHDQKREDRDTASVYIDLITLTGEQRNRFTEALEWGKLSEHLEAFAAGHDLHAGQMRAAIEGVNQGDPLVLLRITDRGTRGLTGEEDANGTNYKALVRNVLDTTEDRAQRGGSHGLGKAVLWAFSQLGTVLFSSTIEVSGAEHFRLIGRADLSYHVTDGEEWAGPGWLGSRDPDRLRAVSMWDALAGARAGDLLLDRPDEHGTGTTILIVGFHEPREEAQRPVDEVAMDVAYHVAENFWPAIIRGTLRVEVRAFDNDEFLGSFDPPIEGELALLRRAIENDQVADRAAAPGDVSERFLSLKIPARIASSPGALDEPETRAEIRLRLIRAAEDEEGVHLNQVALVRGAGMVVRYWRSPRQPLAGGGFRAVLQAGLALNDLPRFDDDSNHALEAFLRAAEPPAHNEWDGHTPRLKSSYRPGAVARIKELWDDLAKAIVDMCEQKPPADAAGPDLMKKLLPLGTGGPPPRPGFQVDYDRRRSGLDVTGTWVLGATVTRTRSLAGRTPWGVDVAATLEGDSGRGEYLQIVDIRLEPGSSAEGALEDGQVRITVPASADAVAFTVRADDPAHGRDLRRISARLRLTIRSEGVSA